MHLYVIKYNTREHILISFDTIKDYIYVHPPDLLSYPGFTEDKPVKPNIFEQNSVNVILFGFNSVDCNKRNSFVSFMYYIKLFNPELCFSTRRIQACFFCVSDFHEYLSTFSSIDSFLRGKPFFQEPKKMIINL